LRIAKVCTPIVGGASHNFLERIQGAEPGIGVVLFFQDMEMDVLTCCFL
jgi:hypothetical protein